MNDKYVQIFTGDFNDFEKHKGKFKDCQIRIYWLQFKNTFELSLVSFLFFKKSIWIPRMTSIFQLWPPWLKWFPDFQKSKVNSMNDKDVQAFSGNFTETWESTGISRIDKNAQVFHLSLRLSVQKKHKFNHSIFQIPTGAFEHVMTFTSNSAISGCCDLLEWLSTKH